MKESTSIAQGAGTENTDQEAVIGAGRGPVPDQEVWRGQRRLVLEVTHRGSVTIGALFDTPPE